MKTHLLLPLAAIGLALSACNNTADDQTQAGMDTMDTATPGTTGTMNDGTMNDGSTMTDGTITGTGEGTNNDNTMMPPMNDSTGAPTTGMPTEGDPTMDTMPQ